ncbi:MAG: hypothetical protein WAM71_01670 [Candidatus Korobacteraceae bacterium]
MSAIEFPLVKPGTLHESRLETIWERARNQNDDGRTRAALDAIDKPEALAMLGAALQRMKLFEAAADCDRANGLKISRETAARIENVWIFSGVGTLRTPVKQPNPEKNYKADNPALIKEFLQWGNRRRFLHGMLVAQRIAEARSGKQLPGNLIGESAEDCKRAEAVRDSMRQYGPLITFGGFFQENDEAKKVRLCSSNGFPPEKFIIVEPAPGEPEWKTTADQVKNFQTPPEVSGMTTALVSDDVHLNRIVHIAGKFHEYLPEARPLYLFPSALPEYGRPEYEGMELQGLLAYVYRDGVAAAEAYPHTLRR